MMGFGSEMNRCGQFVKIGLLLSNVIIFVGGVTVFCIGVWTLVDKAFINELLGTNLFMGAVYILIAMGALVTVVSFFGCLGAVKEVKCVLLTYFIMLLIIFVVMLVGGILGYVFREKVRYSMEQEMYSSIKSYNEKKSLRRAWDDTQDNLRCCGVTSYTDWRGLIPDSCCRDLAGKKLPCKSFQSDGNIYTDGCLHAAEVFVKDHASIIGAAAITVSGLMIFGLIFAFILFKII